MSNRGRMMIPKLPQRVVSRNRLLATLHRAIGDGVPVKGYFLWSFMDNYEWGFGYTKRFGIVHVDYASQQRTLKASGRWYRDLIAASRG